MIWLRVWRYRWDSTYQHLHSHIHARLFVNFEFSPNTHEGTVSKYHFAQCLLADFQLVGQKILRNFASCVQIVASIIPLASKVVPMYILQLFEEQCTRVNTIIYKKEKKGEMNGECGAFENSCYNSDIYISRMLSVKSYLLSCKIVFTVIIIIINSIG